MLQFTKLGRKIYLSVCSHLSGTEKMKFKEEMARLYDQIITGDEQREYKLDEDDVEIVLREMRLIKPITN